MGKSPHQTCFYCLQLLLFLGITSQTRRMSDSVLKMLEALSCGQVCLSHELSFSVMVHLSRYSILEVKNYNFVILKCCGQVPGELEVYLLFPEHLVIGF